VRGKNRARRPIWLDLDDADTLMDGEELRIVRCPPKQKAEQQSAFVVQVSPGGVHGVSGGPHWPALHAP
jgi:hypothetical protein